jgi:ABC-2 type transport system permease protein
VTAAGTIIEAASAPSIRVGGGVWSVFRTERRKLSAQLATRLLALICIVGPFAFAIVLKVQSGTPTDALFGAWVHSSGFAISLVVLGFAGAWGFPLMAGVLAGDMYSSEDRHGTWKTILTRSCTREEIFAGKLLTALVFTAGLVALTACSSLVAGLLLVGNHSLVDLSGALLPPGRGLALVLVSWLYCVLPVLAYTSLAVLLSVGTRNGIVGVIGPVLIALASQLLALIGKGVFVHLLLIGSAFDGWHGLFTTHPFYGDLVLSSLVSVAWIAACLGASWLIFSRRNFAGTTLGRGSGWMKSIRVVATAAAVIALLAFAGNWGPVGVTAARLRASIGSEFNNVTLLQQHLLGRAIPPGANLDLRPSCNRGAAAPIGPGDWTCNVDVYIPEPGKVPFQETIVTYDVSVQANGCYKAASPPTFVGQQTMKDAQGRSVVNPLFVVYGCFNTL